MRRFASILLVWLALGSVAGDALAVIGRPATPMSYAGVARRTTRRAVSASAYYGPTSAATVAAVGATVPVLPAGCGTVVMNGAPYSQCGGSYYKPYYQGTNVVYVAATP